MSLFLHLKYTTHKTKPIHTLAVTRNIVISVIPVLLKTKETEIRRTTLEQIMYFWRMIHFRFRRNEIHPWYFSITDTVLCITELFASVLVLIQTTTVHMV